MDRLSGSGCLETSGPAGQCHGRQPGYCIHIKGCQVVTTWTPVLGKGQCHCSRPTCSPVRDLSANCLTTSACPLGFLWHVGTDRALLTGWVDCFWNSHYSHSHSACLSAIWPGHSFSQQEVESIPPSVDQGWPCDLLWLIECSRRDTGWLPGLSQKRLYSFHICLLGSQYMERRDLAQGVLEDEMPCGRE